MTQTILTYGDSNTHGTPPMDSTAHHPRLARRWPVIMAERLGSELIEDGLGGRTACAMPANSVDVYLDGQIGLHMALRAHGPIDQLIIMLGTNDLLTKFGKTAEGVMAGVGGLLALAHAQDIQARHDGFQTTIICPPPVLDLGTFDPEFMGAAEKSAALPELLRTLAARWHCRFLDAGTLIASDPRDGVHFDEEKHAILGQAVADLLKD